MDIITQILNIYPFYHHFLIHDFLFKFSIIVGEDFCMSLLNKHILCFIYVKLLGLLHWGHLNGEPCMTN